LTFFFITGVIAAGILVPYNSPLLTEAIATGVGAEASPFVVGQKIRESSRQFRLSSKHAEASHFVDTVRIKYLPDVFNFFIITSALSSANGYSQSSFSFERLCLRIDADRAATSFSVRWVSYPSCSCPQGPGTCHLAQGALFSQVAQMFAACTDVVPSCYSRPRNLEFPSTPLASSSVLSFSREFSWMTFACFAR
jgi:hypothetical protein